MIFCKLLCHTECRSSSWSINFLYSVSFNFAEHHLTLFVTQTGNWSYSQLNDCTQWPVHYVAMNNQSDLFKEEINFTQPKLFLFCADTWTMQIKVLMKVDEIRISQLKYCRNKVHLFIFFQRIGFFTFPY